MNESINDQDVVCDFFNFMENRFNNNGKQVT